MFDESAGDEPTAIDAKAALTNGVGNEAALVAYLHDLAEAIRLLAEPRTLRAGNSITERPQEDWEGTLAQLKTALSEESPDLVAGYARDAAEFLGHLAQAIDPTLRTRDWKLVFKRKGRGRRSDPYAIFEQTRLWTELHFATRKLGKKEAAIAAEQEKLQKAGRPSSRATINRKLSPRKP